MAIETNKIETNKEHKKVKIQLTKGQKGCKATLVVQIIFTVLLVVLAMAPVLGVFFGIFMFFIYAITIGLVTVCSFFLILLSDSFKAFASKAWQVVVNVFKGSGTIRTSLKPYIIWMSLGLLVISSVGFIYNLVYYIKKDKTQRGKFIASCIFFGVAAIATAICMPVYLA